jgi:hypothetical protein
MKLYRARISTIAHAVIERLGREGDIEVAPENREEAERDIVAILDTFLRRDQELHESVREDMERRGLPYDQYGRTRKEVAERWGHPLGDEVERYLSRQIVENFMISRFIEEVFGEDREIYKKVLDTMKKHDVDENALRQEAKERIKNVVEGSVEYQEALARALREVRKRHGLQ